MLREETLIEKEFELFQTRLGSFPVVQILFASICSVMTTSVFCRTTLISLPVIASCNVFCFRSRFFGGEILLSCVNLRPKNLSAFNIFYCLEFG